MSVPLDDDIVEFLADKFDITPKLARKMWRRRPTSVRWSVLHFNFLSDLQKEIAKMPGMKNTMGEFKRGQLHSGSKKGPVVKNRAQAIAIGLSEDRKAKGQRAKRLTGKKL